MAITAVEVVQMGIDLLARATKAEDQVKKLTEQLKLAETALHEAKQELEKLHGS